MKKYKILFALLIGIAIAAIAIAVIKPKTIRKKLTAELTITGDFLYEEPYYAALRAGEDENLYFSKIKKYFQKDDLSIGNMEVVISDGNMEISGAGYDFCAPQSIGKQVIDLGMEAMSTANNHSNDRGMAGRMSTMKFFKENSDILAFGTYEERDVTKNIKEINGIKFGFLAYTYKTNKKIPKNERYSIGLFRDPDTKTITEEYARIIKQETETLRDKVDVLIVAMHWGKEYTFTPTSEQEALANYLNSLGVDIVIGSHSHCMQPIKWINNESKTLVYYSLGNFASADHIVEKTGETFTNAYQVGLVSKLNITLEDGKIEITDIKTEPIINYYDKNLRNFTLIPYSDYTEEQEKSHYLYNNNFNKNFIETTYNKVIYEEFRSGRIKI